jgi:hypothetical protein
VISSELCKHRVPSNSWPSPSFQEQQLASRRLVFQRDRVVFICQKNYGGWSEDVVFEDTMEGIPGDSHDNEDNKAGDNHDGDEDSSDEDGSDEDDSDEDENDSDETRNNDDVTVNVDRSNINDYTDLIMNYSGLSLSYESDRYHAFAGMNRYFKEELLADLCHGIPDSLFDWFLVWVPSSGVLARRDTCPSWSWSGWNGSISVRVMHTFQHKISVIRQQIRRRTWIIWYQRKAHDSEECLLVWSPLQESHDLSPTNFYGGPIQSHFSFDCTQTVPTRRTLDNAPTYLEDSHSPSPGSGFLQFWTVSVYFKLEISANVSYERGTQGHKRVGIFGRDGRELSSILIDPKWAEANVPRIHEFILLCEGQDKPFSFAGRTGWSYIIMLLEWRGDWAERVSLGIIRKDDLFQALGQGPVWKEIILG